MELYKLLIKYREELGLSKGEMARRLEVTYHYYIRLEEPFHRGRAVPSVKLLKKVAGMVARARKNPGLEKEIFKELVQARFLQKFPKEVQHGLLKLSPGNLSNSMPEKFIKRLREDIEKKGGLTKVSFKSGINEEVLEAVLKGEYVLNRPLVITLADALDQSPEEYLALADYVVNGVDVPPEKVVAFFRLAKRVPDEALYKLLDAITTIAKYKPQDTFTPETTTSKEDQPENTLIHTTTKTAF
jgi:DNA-binding XRE family transcriptional regulator